MSVMENGFLTDDRQYDWSGMTVLKFECADWYHRWTIFGYCERCGKKVPHSRLTAAEK